MKLKNIFLVMFAAALAMVGCTKPIDFGDPDIKVTPEEIQVPMAGGSVTVTVNTTRAWKLRDLPDWIVAEPDHGPASFEDQQVTLTFLENKKGNRYASIKFFAGIVSEFADIAQPGPDGETGGIDQITIKEFLEKADPNTEYRLVGVVSAFNSKYCSFDLTDESGSTVYVYSVDDASKEEFASQIMNGGIVTLTGKYYYYQNSSDPSKNKVEINSAHIERYEDPAPIDPSTIEQITVAEFIQKADPNTTYRLVGKVRNFNSTYCSFDLVDETGSVYVYKCDDASKAEFGSKIMNDGVITITGKYFYYEHATDPSKNKVEINPATIEKYEDPGVIDPTTIEQITVAEFIQKADPNTTYRLVGTVSNFNSQYCSFDLTDASGTIYVYSLAAASKTEFGSKIQNGGKVTLTGKYYYYQNSSDPSKNKVEIKDATIEKYEGSTDPVDPGKIEQITVAEFIQKADPNTTYRLVGKVSNFNSQYCSFDLTDDTGSVYIYSVDAASKEAFGSKIQNGGKVTLTGKYYYYEHATDPTKNKVEINPATIEKYEGGSDPVDPVDTGDSVILTFPDDNSANNAGSGYGLSWVAKKGNISFDVVNFNNNKWNNNWTFIKCGHKSTAYNSSIANSTPIPAKIDKVIVNIDRVLDASKVTAFELVVATDANFSTVTETIKGTMAQGDQTFNIANPIANGYYKIVINCNALGGSTNGCVTVAKIVYSAKAN